VQPTVSEAGCGGKLPAAADRFNLTKALPIESATSRLMLRRCEGSDVEAVLAYRQRSDVGKYLRDGTWSHAKAVREIAAYSVAPFSAPGDELVLLAETRDGAAVVGEVGLLWSGERTAEIGYVFNPRYGGQGLATEAVSAIINFARCPLGFLRVIARTVAANVASIALCRRLGMHLLSTALSTDGRRVMECVFSTGVRTDAAGAALRDPRPERGPYESGPGRALG